MRLCSIPSRWMLPLSSALGLGRDGLPLWQRVWCHGPWWAGYILSICRHQATQCRSHCASERCVSAPRLMGLEKNGGVCMNWPDKITHAIHCGLLLAVFVVLSSLLYWLLRS